VAVAACQCMPTVQASVILSGAVGLSALLLHNRANMKQSVSVFAEQIN